MDKLGNITPEEEALRNNNNMIWHYTSASTFAELMKCDSKLYGTLTTFLNDSFEFMYAQKNLQLFLERYFQQNTFNFGLNVSKSKQELQTAVKTLNGKFDMFVTCFCKSCDDLSLWRAYTKEGGFAIGFDRTEIEKELNRFGTIFYVSLEHEQDKVSSSLPIHAKENDGVKFIYDCFYSETEQQRFFSSLIEGNQMGDISNTPTVTMAIVSALFKEPSFQEEKEVRLVLNIPNDKKHRQMIQYIGGKPRIETGIINVSNFIKGVFISPNGDKEHNYQLAKLFSSQTDNTFPVYISNSSFNGY